MSFGVYCPAIDPDGEWVAALRASIEPLALNVIDGRDAPSFSKLVNDCWEDAFVRRGLNYCVFASDRVRPSAAQIESAVESMSDGWAMVSPYRFACFVVSRATVARVGWFDERYVGGGVEDADYQIRMCEANVAFWEQESAPYVRGPTRWAPSDSRDTPSWKHHRAKWGQGCDTPGGGIETCRAIAEETIRPTIMASAEFLPWKRSRTLYWKPEAIVMAKP